MSNTTMVPQENNPLEAMQRADIDVQMTTARRYPRDIAAVKRMMLDLATLDEDTAAACFYTLPRGGKSIQGPSVRLAELALSCYGNVRAGTRIILTEAHGENPHVIVQGVAHDLQTNVAVSMESRRRITKKQTKAAPDDDDIALATNACSAIAYRNTVFKIVPGVLVQQAFEAAKRVAVGDAKSLVQRRGRAVEKLGKVGITPDRIIARLGRTSVELITTEDLETLFGLHTAIKEGTVTIEEAFPILGGTVAGSKPSLKDDGNDDPVGEVKKEEPPVTTPTTPAPQTAQAASAPAATPKAPKKPKVEEVKKVEEKKDTAQPELKVVDAPQAEPVSEAVAPNPEPVEQKATEVEGEADIYSHARTALHENVIAEDKFLGWLAMTGRFGYPQKDGTMEPVESLNMVPPEKLTEILSNAKAMAKCKSLYGKPT